MTVDEIEEDFPRGGIAKGFKKTRNFVFEKKNINEYKVKKPGRRERKRKASRVGGLIETGDDHEDEVKFNRFERLSYQGLSEGTIALCCVREIHNKYIDISMPGRLSARLYIENISEPFNELLKDDKSMQGDGDLRKVMRVGQLIACSTLSVANKGHQLARVSSDPGLVNSSLSFSSVVEGLVLQMAVKSQEDHGYMMYAGIPALTTFLPSPEAANFIENTNGGLPLSVGQIVWCMVIRTKLAGSSNTVHVTLDANKIEDSKLVGTIDMVKLLPGVKVDVTITKVISQTLLVTINGTGIEGYVDEANLSTRWSKLSDYEIGSLHTATVLFKFPYAKMVALTFKTSITDISQEEIPLGTLFPDAEVMSILKRGVCFKLVHNGRSLKGMVSVRRIGHNVNIESLSTKFPLGNHISCRVIGYDALEQVYSLSTDDKILNEKHLSRLDLYVGEQVEVIVDSMKKGGLEVLIGSVKAFVPWIHISDVVHHNPSEIVKMKSTLKGKVLKNNEKGVVVTLRPTLVKNNSLLSFDDVNVGEAYYGYVTKILPNEIIVSFFGDNFVHIKETNLLMPPDKYSFGELVKCYVMQKTKDRIPVMSLMKSVQGMPLTIGDTHNLIVKEVSEEGLTCLFTVKGQNFNGFLPVSHLNANLKKAESEMDKYPHGSIISKALLISLNEKLPLFSLRKEYSDFFKENPKVQNGVKNLNVNDRVPCSVSEVLTDKLVVCPPLPHFNGKISISSKFLPMPTSSYKTFQTIYTRVSKVFPNNTGVSLSGRLNDGNKPQEVLKNTSSNDYTNPTNTLEKNHDVPKKKKKTGTVGFNESQIDEKNKSDEGTPAESKDLNEKKKKKKKKNKKAKSDKLVAELDAPRTRVAEKPSEKETSMEENTISSKNIEENTILSKKTKKRKLEEKLEPVAQQTPKKKKGVEIKDMEVESSEDLLEKAASFVWDATTEDLSKAAHINSEDRISEDDSDDDVKAPPRKLTAAEKRAAAAEKERQIRAKEEELLHSESKPESPEHFDRLLTASPNDSKLWIMYMAYHMEATEVEKARAVAKRALKHINVREEEGRLNVWIASLNLENMYGSPDSFKEVLSEALKYNDDYKVYQHVLDIYSESKKTVELEKLVNQLVKKYKTNIDCWLKCQEALMKAGLPDKARNNLQRSLEALPNKEYCSLVARFALVENRYGFPEQAQSLFENLLTSYPKRTDIWSVYIDMLSKSGSIDLARNVLERATSQKLPLRKMKSLYQKWLKLEESFGTPESAKGVKDAAEAFVSNLTAILNKED